MTDPVDKIGVVRQHRWVSADDQASVLRERCRRVVSLGGGKTTRVEFDQLVTLARDGTMIECVHAFLLADPRAKRKAGGMKAEFREALAKLEKRGARVMDLDGSVCSEKQRKALLLLVDSDITRSNRGAKSATNGAKNPGRPTYEPTPEELDKARDIWGNTRSYREWADADKALKARVNKLFTMWRAYDEFGPRKETKR